MQEVDLDALAPTQPSRALRDRVQHRVGVGGGPAEGDQHGIGGDKLLDDRIVILQQASVIFGGRLVARLRSSARLSCDVERWCACHSPCPLAGAMA